MKIAIIKILFIGICLSSGLSFSQVKESERLKKQQQELEAKINFTENLLKSTSQSKSSITKSISLISNKIQYREELLNNISIQLKDLNTDIILLEDEIEVLSKQLVVLENQYKDMIVQAYKMRSGTASIFFVLSARNYNQANRRMAYLDQLTKYRADQIRRIKALKVKLEEALLLLNQKRADQESLLSTKEREKLRYMRDRTYKVNSIKSLEGKEQELQKELAAQRKKSEDIKREITKAINKEIAEAQRKAKEKPKSLKETKEIELSNAGFEANKGRLPWPVSKGEVTKGFGKQAHPLHIGVFTYNNGVDISTVKGASVRAVYKGVVSSVIIIPGAGKAVIVAHGNYRTIYSNLQEVYVQKGDEISTKQEVGSLMLSPDGSLSEVHFEIRKITEDGQISNINPSYWLAQ